MSDSEKTKIALNIEIELKEFISGFSRSSCKIDMCFSGDLDGTIQIHPSYGQNEIIFGEAYQDVNISDSMLITFKNMFNEKIKNIIINHSEEIEKRASEEKSRQDAISELKKDPAVQQYLELVRSRF